MNIYLYICIFVSPKLTALKIGIVISSLFVSFWQWYSWNSNLLICILHKFIAKFWKHTCMYIPFSGKRSVKPSLFIKGIHLKHVVVVSNKACKWPVTKKNQIKHNQPPNNSLLNFLSQCWTPQIILPSLKQNITRCNVRLYGRLLVNSHTTPSALISRRDMFVKQDQLSYHTVLQQNPGTMCQSPRWLLAIRITL